MGAVRLDRKTFFITYFFSLFYFKSFFLCFGLSIQDVTQRLLQYRHYESAVHRFAPDWLDEKELERHCSRRDIAYVKEQVAEFGNKTVVEAKEKPYGDSCLMNVVYWGQETCKKNPEICAQETLELVEYLLGIGADVNDKFYDGNYTAIAVATQNRDIPLMKLLLENKADIEIADLWGETPIFHTIGINSWSTDGSSALSLLIDNGANINAKDMYGRTALQVATSANSLRGRDGPVMELLQAAEKKQSGL